VEGCKIAAYDPAAMENTKKQVPNASYAGSAAECAGLADVLAITTAWPEPDSPTKALPSSH
jgi:UDPglucose 6-dehydrogenase